MQEYSKNLLKCQALIYSLVVRNKLFHKIFSNLRIICFLSRCSMSSLVFLGSSINCASLIEIIYSSSHKNGSRKFNSQFSHKSSEVILTFSSSVVVSPSSKCVVVVVSTNSSKSQVVIALPFHFKSSSDASK